MGCCTLCPAKAHCALYRASERPCCDAWVTSSLLRSTKADAQEEKSLLCPLILLLVQQGPDCVETELTGGVIFQIVQRLPYAFKGGN